MKLFSIIWSSFGSCILYLCDMHNYCKNGNGDVEACILLKHNVILIDRSMITSAMTQRDGHFKWCDVKIIIKFYISIYTGIVCVYMFNASVEP